VSTAGREMPMNSPTDTDTGGAFVALQSLVLSTQSVDEFLDDLARLAADMVGPQASCGVTTHRDGHPLTVASSDPRAEQVDEVQYEDRQGPCLDTLATGRINDVSDLAAEERWPEYRAHALRHGVRCSLSLPLAMMGTTVGALNLYGFDTPGLFTDDHRRRGQLFASQATTALTLVLRRASQSDIADQLEQALASRSVIDQALGILMAQQRCTADEAFALLRTHSQNNNRKLRDVAADLITRVTGSTPSPPRPFDRGSTSD
jgi:GAF domain-containing protein